VRVPRPKMPGLKAGSRLALRTHLLDRAAVARERYAPFRDVSCLEALLADRECVRFPTRITWVRDPGGPLSRLVAPEEDGGEYEIRLCEQLRARPEAAAAAVAMMLPAISYGAMPTDEDAELFAAALSGVEVNTLRAWLRGLAREFRAP
jgi:hypothetical protein